MDFTLIPCRDFTTNKNHGFAIRHSSGSVHGLIISGSDLRSMALFDLRRIDMTPIQPRMLEDIEVLEFLLQQSWGRKAKLSKDLSQEVVMDLSPYLHIMALQSP